MTVQSNHEVLLDESLHRRIAARAKSILKKHSYTWLAPELVEGWRALPEGVADGHMLAVVAALCVNSYATRKLLDAIHLATRSSPIPERTTSDLPGISAVVVLVVLNDAYKERTKPH